MLLNIVTLCCLLQLGRAAPQQNQCRNFDEKISYPAIRRNESVFDNYNGILVADPYRWLENPNSNETKRFVRAENKISKPLLKDCNEWKTIKKQLTKLTNYTKYTVPERHGNYYLFKMNSGLQNQGVLYKQKTLDSEPSVLLDPNRLLGNKSISLKKISYSINGAFLAYSFSVSGSDWESIKIRDVESGKDYSDLLQRVKFSDISWTHDNKGFFYVIYPKGGDGLETEKNENQKLYYHRVGDSQDKDVLVVEFTDHPEWVMLNKISDDGRYLIIPTFLGAGANLIFYADLTENGDITGKLQLIPLIDKFDATYEYVTNNGTKMVLRTNKDAPNYRLITIDLNNPDEMNWTTLIEEKSNVILETAILVDRYKLLIVYIEDVKSILEAYTLDTGKLLIKIPIEIGYVSEIVGSRDSSEIFFELKSFLIPGTIYRYDFGKSNSSLTVFREAKPNIAGFDKNNYKVEQIFYPSRDGTKIPMYIVQKKTSNQRVKPCWLYGYGGFGVSVMPSFHVDRIFFIDQFDGIFALANIRGGGEYGENWHTSGNLLNKQNVFDDYQAAAKYLTKNRYTRRKNLGIYGRSNGGLLIGACINQRPDLFGAAIVHVGVMDMLRYQQFTIGGAWIPDYGNSSETIHFNNMYKYSPLHNVHTPNSTKNQYPATLIMTADHDDRVVPLHSFKFAAALQNAVRNNPFQTNPILLRVYTDAGHGGEMPTSKLIEQSVDILTFFYRALHIRSQL